MAEKPNYEQQPDDLDLNNPASTDSPDILEGDRQQVTGGRRLTKTPLIVILVIAIVSIAMIAFAMINSTKHDEAQLAEDEPTPGAQTSGDNKAPEELFKNAPTNGSIAPAPAYSLSGAGTSAPCLENVIGPDGQLALNPDGSPQQRACGNLSGATTPVATAPLEGSLEDYQNKRRLMLLDAERQRLEMQNQNMQALNQARIEAVRQREGAKMQAISDEQNMLGSVLGASTTINGNLKKSSSSGSSGGGLMNALGGSSSAPDIDSVASRSGGNDRPSMDELNGQSRKADFAKSDQSEDVYLNKALVPALSPYEVKAGTVIPGVMVSGISSDLPGQIVGQVSQNVYDNKTGKYLLIPQGAKLVGLYDNGVTLGQTRILIAWTRIIYPDGASISLENMSGYDQAGYAGFHDKVNNHYVKLFGQATLLSLLSAGAQLSQPQASNGENINERQTVAGAIGQQYSELGTELARRNMNIAPTLKIRPGYRFNIMVKKDMILKPYH
ncbi:TrbI/VirB10 family protein [Alkanindiges illinoisensis]|uniref:TrbI/VirB10 family protein n=1 Tax=Alkanindiges illinoisensis TaxID=197183 RepID=UPI000686C43D|nr:TrbI/VirB10 family protein [Alkanindiges illinoisensis]